MPLLSRFPLNFFLCINSEARKESSGDGGGGGVDGTGGTGGTGGSDMYAFKIPAPATRAPRTILFLASFFFKRRIWD